MPDDAADAGTGGADATARPEVPRPPGEGRRPPAVLAAARGERRRALVRREVRRLLPSLGLALLVHLAVLWWLASLPGGDGSGEARPLEIQASVSEPEPLEELIPPHESSAPVTPDEQLADPVVFDELVEEDVPVGQDVLGVRGGYGLGGRGGGRAGRGEGVDLGALGDEASPFRQFVEDLRNRGLDVVFVVDATASMGPFIAAARATIDDVIVDLATVVPKLRLGIVAYRDEVDEWLVKHVELTDDRYRIHNFLLDLDAVGGGDFPEAVDVGLRFAFDDLDWRPEARRVVILVGDAPPHDRDQASLLSAVRAFTRTGDALVNVLYTGGDADAERATQTRRVMEQIARAGQGLLADLSEDATELRERITDASFGPQWRDDVARLLGSGGGTDPKRRIIDDKLAAGQRAWFLRNLEREPIHPALAEGYIQLMDAKLARHALDLLLDEGRPDRVRSCALYVLKRGVDAGVVIDISRPLADQTVAVARMRSEVERLGPAPRTMVPPPPPGTPPLPGPSPRR